MAGEQHITIHVSDQIGDVSGVLLKPEGAQALFVMAHGAGAGMQHTFMEQIAVALFENNWATLRFNFPFAEKKQKRPDLANIAEETVAAAIRYAQRQEKGLPLFVGGKSFGGRMTSQYIAKNSISGIAGIIFLGFPLHPAGKPSIARAEHLSVITLPMLFIQGTRDLLADKNLIQKVFARLSGSSLRWIDSADHGFTQGKNFRIEEITEAILNWKPRLN